MDDFREQPNIEQQEQTFEGFQKEITELKEAELEENGDNANPDLMQTNTDELNEKDMEAWQCCKDLTMNNVTQKDMDKFQEYRMEIRSSEDVPVGRVRFSEFLANRLSVAWAYKELKDEGLI